MSKPFSAQQIILIMLNCRRELNCIMKTKKVSFLTVLSVMLLALMSFITVLGGIVPFEPIEPATSGILARIIIFLLLLCASLFACIRIDDRDYFAYVLLFFPLSIMFCHLAGLNCLISMPIAVIVSGDTQLYATMAFLSGLLTFIWMIIEIHFRWAEKLFKRKSREEQ